MPVTGGIIHIVAPGTCTITASQIGSHTYAPAADVSATLTVSKANLLIAAVDTVRNELQPNPVFRLVYTGFIKGETVNNLLTPPVVNTTADQNSPQGAYPITVTGAGSNNYAITYQGGTLTVIGQYQSVTFGDMVKTYGDPDFDPGATASSGLPVTYISSDPAVAVVTANGTLKIIGVGIDTIRAIQAGDANWAPASLTKILKVNKASLTIVVDSKSKARKLSDKLGLGLTLRYIHSCLASGQVNGTNYKAGNAIAADVSLYYDGRKKTGNGSDRAGQGWSGGLVLSNLGSKISYSNDATAKDFLPANLGLGFAYHGIVEEYNTFTLSGEANKLLVPLAPPDSAGQADYHAMGIAKSWTKSFSNSAYRFSIGGEYGYKDLFFLRLGYTAQTQEAGNLKYWTAGLGLKWTRMGIDFSYIVPSGSGVTRNPLSNTFRVGLSFAISSNNK